MRLSARCVFAIIGGMIIGIFGGIQVATALATYLMPGPPTVLGVGLIIAFSVIGWAGGIISAGVQFCDTH